MQPGAGISGAPSPATSSSTGSVLAPQRPANLIYFPALDGVRALAFFMVFGAHYLEMSWGFGGVDVFFVLSGFLITGILFDTRGQPHRVRNFYIRRTLRIFPLYYGVMLLLVLSYPLFRWEWSWGWLLWPAYLGNFLRGIHPYTLGSAWEQMADFIPTSRTFPGVQLYLGHFWSLCVEEQFYLIWPWAVFWLRDRRKLIYVCAAWVVVCPVLRIVATHKLPPYMVDEAVLSCWTPFRIDALMLGGLIALVRRGPSARAMLIAARAIFVVLLSFIVFWSVFGVSSRHNGQNFKILFIDAFSGCLIVMALESGSIIYRIFNLRPLRWVGRISYGAYVFHSIPHPEIITFVLRRHAEHPEAVIAIIGIVYTLLISWASFRWFESPFIRLKERWTQPISREKEPVNCE